MRVVVHGALRAPLTAVCRRYKTAETALMTGSMLRDCLKNPALAKCEPTVLASSVRAPRFVDIA